MRGSFRGRSDLELRAASKVTRIIPTEAAQTIAAEPVKAVASIRGPSPGLLRMFDLGTRSLWSWIPWPDTAIRPIVSISCMASYAPLGFRSVSSRVTRMIAPETLAKSA